MTIETAPRRRPDRLVMAVPPYRTAFDARALAPSTRSRSTASACAARRHDPALGYDVMKLFAEGDRRAPPEHPHPAPRRIWQEPSRPRSAPPVRRLPGAVPGRRGRGRRMTPGPSSSSGRPAPAMGLPASRQASSPCSTPSVSAKFRSRSAPTAGTASRLCTLSGGRRRYRGALRGALGDAIGVRGPFGTAWPLDEAEGRDVVIVAGGIGLAPLRPAIYHLPRIAIASRLRHRLRRTLARRVALHLRTGALAARLDISVHVTVDTSSAGWRGPVGVVTTLLRASHSIPTTYCDARRPRNDDSLHRGGAARARPSERRRSGSRSSAA